MSGQQFRDVLGLDPGTQLFGAALVRFRGNSRKPLVIGFWVIAPKTMQSRSTRLGEILVTLDQLVFDLDKGTTAAIEGGFMGAVGASLAIAEARGVACGILGRHGITVDTVSPKSGKMAATGKGNATKGEVVEAIASLCELPPGVDRLPEDASDAVAVALSSMLTAGLWRRPELLDLNRKRRAKRARTVASFVNLATRRIGGQ